MKISTSAALFTVTALSSFPEGKADCETCFLRLHDARGAAPDPFLTCVKDGDVINLCDYGVTSEDITLVYQPCNVDDLESVKFRVNDEKFNCEKNGPYSINQNNGNDHFPWSAPLGEIDLVVGGYTEDGCRARDRINRERLTITLVDECACGCDDSNMCTTDTCDGAGGCVFTPSEPCDEGESCDPTDGICKPTDSLVPCIAVIDEDGSFGTPNQFDMWNTFREDYPDRKFCLLVPTEGCCGTLVPPQNFLDEVDAGTAVLVTDVTRDNGSMALAEDWLGLCGFDNLSPVNVPFVGLFLDTSGSLTQAEVQASLNLFNTNTANAGLTIQQVFNGNENWILPFLTTLIPPTP